MISITDIKEGIAETIEKATINFFKPGLVITDEPYSKVSGPSFLITAVAADPELFSLEHVHTNYRFDVTYLAPEDESNERLDEIGQAVTAGFFAPVSFGGRHILPTNISSARVDKDYHTLFDIAFFDDIKIRKESEYQIMSNLAFRLELNADTKE